MFSHQTTYQEQESHTSENVFENVFIYLLSKINDKSQISNLKNNSEIK